MIAKGVLINILKDDLSKRNVVYKITFPNDKVYIGITINKLYDRIKSHCYKSFNEKSIIYKLAKSNAIRKYMKIDVSILYCGDDIKQKEIEYIKLYNSTDKKFGYNETYGGECNIPTKEARVNMSKAKQGCTPWNKGIPQTEEVKNKLSFANKGKEPPNKGKKMPKDMYKRHIKKMKERVYTEEEKQFMAERLKPYRGMNKGIKFNDEWRKKLSDAKIDYIPWNKGLSMKEETKIKLSKSKTGVPNKGRFEILCYDINGNYMGLFTKYKDAANYVNGKPDSIKKCCIGEFSQYKGYKFKYKN